MTGKATYGKSELIRIEAKRQKEKISLMTVLLAACCFLTYYFHEVLGIGAVFTHSFYIPITFGEKKYALIEYGRLRYL